VDRLLERIPPNASVAATQLLPVHLSHRTEVYSLPEPFVRMGRRSPLTRREYAQRAAGVRNVAYRRADGLAEGPLWPPPRFSAVLQLLERRGFVEIGSASGVHLLERR
jgi:hypothetical protein